MRPRLQPRPEGAIGRATFGSQVSDDLLGPPRSAKGSFNVLAATSSIYSRFDVDTLRRSVAMRGLQNLSSWPAILVEMRQRLIGTQQQLMASPEPGHGG
jgi:hypothetical protein